MNLQRTIIVSVAIVLLTLSMLYLTVPVFRSGIRFLVWSVTSNTQVSRGFVPNDGARLYYKVYGQGPPLVLLHGGLSSGLDWLGEIPALSQYFMTIVIDLRGQGHSSSGSTKLTYRVYADDVRAVLDKLGVAQTDIVGWSDGGNTGLLFALDFPARLKRLVAISANFQPAGIPGLLSSAAQAATNQPESWFGRWLYRLQSPEPGMWSQLREKVQRMWRHYPQLTAQELGRIRAPTLVIIGSDDDVSLAHAKAMTAAIPGAELVVVPMTGHAVVRDAPTEVVARVLDFLCLKSMCR